MPGGKGPREPNRKGGPVVVLVLTTEKDAPPVERETLFSIDGVEYDIPKTFGANVGLQLARLTMTRGTDVAVSWALETALGEKGHAALMGFDQLTPEQLHQVTQVVLTRIAGGMEVPKGGLRVV